MLQKLRTLASEHQGGLALIGAAVPIGCAKGSASEPAREADSSTQVEQLQDVGTDALVEMFRDGSPEDVAAALEALIDGSADALGADSADALGADSADGAGSDAGKPRAVARPKLRVPPTAEWGRDDCLYKGVTF